MCFVSLSTKAPLGLNIFGEHLGTFPLARASVWFINPCDSYYDFRMHPGDSHQGTLKNKAYYSYPGTLRATQRGWGESKGGRKAMGSAFIVVNSGVHRFSLYWWIKSIRAEINVQEGKSRFKQEVSYLYHLGLSKRETLWLEQPGSWTNFVAENVLTWGECLKMDCPVSKSWCQEQHYNQKS